MTRRNRSNLPPRLDDDTRGPKRPRVDVAPPGPSLNDQLKRAHVAGRSARFGRDEVVALMRRLAAGAPPARLGLDPLGTTTYAQVEAAVAAVYGWEGDGPRARIAASSTVAGFDAAMARVLEVARAGGDLAFATARPASLLPLHCAIAASASAAGGKVLSARESGPIGTGGRRLRWLDDVAVVTDGVQLLGDDDVPAAEELLFTLSRPDLLVADRCFAGVALNAGIEVVAFADLDALALAVAAHRGRSVRVVPLDERRPPVAYQALRGRLAELAQADGPLDPAQGLVGDGLDAPRGIVTPVASHTVP
ncbi:MAG: phosphatase [Acidimicrobiia bacterium]